MSQEPLERAEHAIEEARAAAQEVQMPFDGDDSEAAPSATEQADKPEQNEESEEPEGSQGPDRDGQV
jgi:hypothetical protein